MNRSSNNENTSSFSKSLIKSGCSSLKHRLYELNLFSNNPFWSLSLNIKEQIVSTRLFIIFISISLLIVIIYTSLMNRIHEIRLEKFSIDDFERLENLYPNTINVPCSEVSVPYKKFLRLSPIFHEVCQSSFIGDKWISSLFFLNATSHNILDFRTFGFSQFRSLALLCRLARQSIKDTQNIFNSTHFINRHLLSRISFNEITSVISSNLQRNILVNEKRKLNVLSMITAQNRLLSALRTNHYVESIPGSHYYLIHNGAYLEDNQTDEFGCDCRFRGNQCTYPAGLYYDWTLPELGMPAKDNPPPRFQIPGLMGGCISLDTIRQSTLECLYNQSCVNIISLQSNISKPKSLNASLTRFPINITIGKMFDESLFIESWQNKSSFKKYFYACAPRSLSYSYQRRFHLSTIITISLSAFGGLILGWQLITPVIIKISKLNKWKKQQKSHFDLNLEQTPIETAIMQMAPKPLNKVVSVHVHRTIHNFNLFPSNNKNNNEEDEYIGIISTRLYILFIIIGLSILGLSICLAKRNQTYTIKYPTLSKFEELHIKYSSTLICPCTRFSMSYGRITSLIPRYHSICSSEYLKEIWLSYFGRVEIKMNTVHFLTTDFRHSGQSFFDLIRILCTTTNETIENALNVFKLTRLIGINTLSRLQFIRRTQTHMKQFQKQIIYSFVDLIKLIRSSIQTNQLIEGMATNAGPISIYNNQTFKWTLHFQSRDFYKNSCTCALSNQCIRSVGFFRQSDHALSHSNITVPGLVLGCYAIDSLLLSNLECFYNKTCIKFILKNYYFDVNHLVKPLNKNIFQIQSLSNKNSRFYPNTTINDIFLQLFVEDWFNKSDYNSYYNRCAPSYCTYTLSKRFHIPYMLTIMLGFYGGLSVILEIILPPLVKIFLQRWSKHKQNIARNHSLIVITDTTMNNPVSNSDKSSYYYFYNIFKKFLSLNLFVSDKTSNNNQIENEEIIATRIYILLFMLCIIIAILYSGPFSLEMSTIKKSLPTIDIINDLHKKNLSTLTCPCTQAAIHYSTFLSIKGKFNSICSSKYISSSYIYNLYEMNNSISLKLSTHYRILSSLCYLSSNFIENAEKVFGTRELITIETLTRTSFDNQIKSLIITFISQTIADYRRTHEFIIGSFSVNQLLNLFGTNWKMELTDKNEKYLIKTYTKNFKLSNCNCAISSNCSEQLFDDIHIGCFPYDGFRLSKYKNISLEILNNQLFVDKWINQSNYTNYFQKCRPLECQYTLPNKNNPIYILTTILGLYGGLTYILHIIIGQSLLAYQWWKKNRQEKDIEITSIELDTI